MDFGALPPEIISGQLYSGPGSGPMLAVATVWDGLAADLHSTASAYRSAVASLTESWQGPSSAAMATAAAPYARWLSATAAQAKDTALRVTAAAASYRDAFAAAVPPPVIAANRGELANLTAANIFGQHTAAIAAVEAEYGAMWAQDATTMYRYAAAAAAATRTTPFTAPPRITDPDAAPGQPTAVANAAANGTIQQLLENLAAAGALLPENAGNLLNGLTGSTSASASALYESMFSAVASVSKFSGLANIGMGGPNLAMVQFKTFFKAAVPTVEIPASALGAGLGISSTPALTGGLPRSVAAVTAEANLVGRLSVPPSWASATPAIQLVTGLDAAPAAGLPGDLLGSMALGSLAGGAIGGSGPRVLNATGAHRRTTIAELSRKPVELNSVITQLQRTPDAVQHWNVDEAGLDDLVAKLSKKPGVHAVHLAKPAGQEGC